MEKICIAHGKYGFLLPVYSGTDLQLKKLAWQMIDKHEIFMRKALEEARLAEEEGEIPVGAVVVCKDRVIARAHNQTE